MNQIMQLTQAPFSQDLLCQWWHRCGSIIGDLTPELRQVWLTSLSEVIRYYRLSLYSSTPEDRQLFISLCRISLAKTRPFLTRFLISGCIPFSEMEQLHKLETDLETSLEPRCA